MIGGMNSRGFGNLGIVLGTFTLLIIAWFSSGGPIDALRGGPLLDVVPREGRAPELIAVGPDIDVDVKFGSVSVKGSVNDGGQSSGGTSADSTGVQAGESPYKGLVKLSGTSGAKKTDPNKEYITLKISRGVSEPISLSGWSVKSIFGAIFYELPDAERVSTSGLETVDSRVTVSAGDSVIVLTGRSPSGDSFRVNKCSGYFEQFQDFTPSISKRCPTPEDELVFFNGASGFNNECLDFIERLPRCKLFLDSIDNDLSPSCKQFVTEELNYVKCVEHHVNDSDFYQGQWRLFLKRDQEIWKSKREQIKLYDNQGRLVDTISY